MLQSLKMERINPIAALQKQSELLKKEMVYERENYAKALTADRIGSRMQEPGCRYPISLGHSEYNALDQLVLTLFFEVADDETDMDFEPGKPVSFFYLSDNGQSVKETPYQCYVEQVDVGVMSAGGDPSPGGAAVHRHNQLPSDAGGPCFRHAQR